MQDVTRFSMDALVVSSVVSGTPLSKVEVDGDLSLAQRHTLPTPSVGVYAPYNGAALPSLDAPASLEEFQPAALMRASRSRNCEYVIYGEREAGKQAGSVCGVS